MGLWFSYIYTDASSDPRLPGRDNPGREDYVMPPVQPDEEVGETSPAVAERAPTPFVDPDAAAGAPETAASALPGSSAGAADASVTPVATLAPIAPLVEVTAALPGTSESSGASSMQQVARVPGEINSLLLVLSCAPTFPHPSFFSDSEGEAAQAERSTTVTPPTRPLLSRAPSLPEGTLTSVSVLAASPLSHRTESGRIIPVSPLNTVGERQCIRAVLQRGTVSIFEYRYRRFHCVSLFGVSDFADFDNAVSFRSTAFFVHVSLVGYISRGDFQGWIMTIVTVVLKCLPIGRLSIFAGLNNLTTFASRH